MRRRLTYLDLRNGLDLVEVVSGALAQITYANYEESVEEGGAYHDAPLL